MNGATIPRYAHLVLRDRVIVMPLDDVKVSKLYADMNVRGIEIDAGTRRDFIFFSTLPHHEGAIVMVISSAGSKHLRVVDVNQPIAKKIVDDASIDEIVRQVRGQNWFVPIADGGY